jgi:hypothetical protein
MASLNRQGEIDLTCTGCEPPLPEGFLRPAHPFDNAPTGP